MEVFLNIFAVCFKNMFNTSTWNYSKFNFNIGGRLYLPYCLIWGLIAILCIDFLYPWFKKIINKISPKLLNMTTIVVSILMLININLTFVAVMRFGERANNITREGRVFKKVDQIYNDKYMTKRFPKMVAVEKKKRN